MHEFFCIVSEGPLQVMPNPVFVSPILPGRMEAYCQLTDLDGNIIRKRGRKMQRDKLVRFLCTLLPSDMFRVIWMSPWDTCQYWIKYVLCHVSVNQVIAELTYFFHVNSSKIVK